MDKSRLIVLTDIFRGFEVDDIQSISINLISPIQK